MRGEAGDYKRLLWLLRPTHTTEDGGDPVRSVLPEPMGSVYMKSARAFCCSLSTPKVEAIARARTSIRCLVYGEMV